MVVRTVLVSAAFAVAAFFSTEMAWAGTPKIYVALYSGGVAVADPVSFDVWGVVKTGDTPARLLLSPDGRRLFVSIYGEDRVQVIDTETDIVAKDVKVGNAPFAMAFTADGRHMLVGNNRENTLSVVDAAALKEVAKVATKGRPEELVVAKDGKTAYSVQGDGWMEIVDLATFKVTGEVEIPSEVYCAAVDEAYGLLYLGSEADGTVAVYDPATGRVVESIKTSRMRFSFRPGGAEMWYGAEDGIRVYSLKDRRVTDVIPLDAQASNHYIAFSRDGRDALVGSAGENGYDVYVYDAAAREKTGEIKLDSDSAGMVFFGGE